MSAILNTKEAADLLGVTPAELSRGYRQWGLVTRRHPKAGVLFFRSSLMAKRKEIHRLLGIEPQANTLRLVVGGEVAA